MLSKGCFDWMKEWKTCPSSTIAGIHEFYRQLLPTKLYHHNKAGTNPAQTCCVGCVAVALRASPISLQGVVR